MTWVKRGRKGQSGAQEGRGTAEEKTEKKGKGVGVCPRVNMGDSRIEMVKKDREGQKSDDSNV